MDEKNRVTLAHVAAAAGVSKMTASRALRGAGDVSLKKIEMVRQAAKDIGYVGNHLASALSGQRSNLIGVVVPSMANIVFAEVLAGIAEGIEGSGLQPVFGVSDYDLEKEYEVIRNMLSWNPAGLIVTGLDQSDDAKLLLKNADIPVVQIMDVDGDPIDACVGFSHSKAGEEMADTLIAAGRRRFGYVGCALDKDTRARKRAEGFKRALARAGFKVLAEEIGDGPSTTSMGRHLTDRILASRPELDCIYYSNDDLAAGGAFHCLAKGGNVPDDLSLAGFNGLDVVESLPIKVATSRTPRREIGRAAAGRIVNADSETEGNLPRTVEYSTSIDI